MSVVIAILVVIGGVIIFRHGMTLPTWQEEEAAGRDDGFFYEVLFGPPGYKRSRSVGGGLALIVGGLIILISAIIGILT
jgi:hypothetical protein